ncbi:hypothetical protein CW751_11835 [Brumimicrobium salinarum]|uniref:PPM-type phosphatase domain-containing protein n=1 Tax=Brumimicrobium salinarum TaxID=2058658 RepID=A0A2I0R0D3_9FLAO|nr:7TM diverse intracellular signaling domain-containing protein [Brumimicrobium salinarum]PKR80051.1 hypothetical protein CW751_11835 [Brumimicrobium salinarum]
MKKHKLHNILIVLNVCWMFSFINNSFSQIILNDNVLNHSVADQAYIYENPDNSINISELVKNDTLTYKKINRFLEVIDFTSSRWFVKFTVNNPDDAIKVMLETARPITDRVDLYEVKNNRIVKEWKNGDHINFDEKAFPHRKNIFPINFESGESKSFYLVMESDGELINFPFIFWRETSFYQIDVRNNIFHGFYFGLMAFVIVLFLYFYILLRDKTYLFYIFYVFFQSMLQFSLEGFFHQFLAPNQLYISGLAVIFSASFTVGFALLYGFYFLKIRKLNLAWTIYLSTIFLVLISIVIMNFFPGIMHAICYPLVNLASLTASITIIILIIYLKKHGYKVNTAFFTGFVILVIGAAIFILGNLGIIEDARVSELALKVSSALEVLALSISMAQRYREVQLEKIETQNTMREKLESKVEERTRAIRKKGELLGSKNNNMLDSIKYAHRIQKAMLPANDYILEILPKSFLLFIPKEIVSGDFYFTSTKSCEINGLLNVFAIVNCTRTGVPGAFMSFLTNNHLKKIIEDDKIRSTGEVIDQLYKAISISLNNRRDEGINSSVDSKVNLSLCWINEQKNKLFFSAAGSSIFIVTYKSNLKSWMEFEDNINVYTRPSSNKHILIEVKGNTESIDHNIEYNNIKYDTFEYPLFQNDRIYAFTEGMFSYKTDDKNEISKNELITLILNVQNLSIERQKEAIKLEHDRWKNKKESADDVLIMGVEV